MWIALSLAAIVLLIGLFFWMRKRREEGPDPVAIVVLLETVRILDRQHLTAALEAAVPDAQISQIAEERPSYFRFHLNGFELTVAAAPFPYNKEHLAQIRLAQIRDAVERHEAALLLDVWRAPEGRELVDAMPLMGKIAAELMDDTALAVYQWPSQRLNLVTPDLLENFRRGEVLVAMEELVHDEVTLLDEGDQRMADAVAEANARWPEFVQAWRAAEDKGPYAAKFPFDDGSHCEYMWVSVTDISDSKVTGLLMNQPFRVRGVKQGQIVEPPLSDLNDWLYVENEQMHGAFTEAIVRSG